MTWQDWQQWAHHQRKRTSWSYVLQVLPPGHPQFEKLEFAEELLLDELIQRYAVQRRWPRMTSLQRVLLYYRCEISEGLISSLVLSPLAAPRANQFTATVEWLLITHWHREGWHVWTERMRYAKHVIDALRPTPLPQHPQEGFGA